VATLNFAIPIAGPRGKGRIRVVAYKNEVWRFTLLQVYVEGQLQPIDLLSTPATTRAGFLILNAELGAIRGGSSLMFKA
jgi:hypothetical protein